MAFLRTRTTGTFATGTAAIALAAATLSGSASTFTESTGTATPTLAALTVSSTGTAPASVGTSTPTLAALTVSSTGVAPVSGTATPTLDALTSSGTAEVPASGALSSALDAATVSSTATVSGGESTGSLSSALGDATLSGTGTAPASIGSATPSLGTLTLSGTGTAPASIGSSTPTLGTLTVSATGTAPASVGTSTPTLAALTVSGTGAAEAKGASTPSLEALTVSGTGTAEAKGSSSPTLGTLTASGTAAVEAKGTSTPTLSALTASGTVAMEALGTSTPSLAALTISSTGTLTSGPTGDLAQALGAVTVSATGALEAQGSSSPTLGTLTVSATGTAPASVGQTLGIPAADVLLGYWPLDEASGTRLKTLGSLTGASLSEVGGTVGSAAGKYGLATSTTESDATALRGTITGADLTTNGFTFATWFYADSGYNSNNSSIMGIWDGVGAYPGGGASYASLNRFFNSAYLDFTMLFSGGGGAGLGAGNRAGPYALDTWHLVVVTVDAVAKTATVNIDNGSIVKTTPAWTGNLSDLSPDTLSIGGKWATLDTWRGRIDSPMLWSRVLTTAEKESIWGAPPDGVYLASVTLSATGSAEAKATSTPTLDALTASGAGVALVAGSATPVLNSVITERVYDYTEDEFGNFQVSIDLPGFVAPGGTYRIQRVWVRILSKFYANPPGIVDSAFVGFLDTNGYNEARATNGANNYAEAGPFTWTWDGLQPYVAATNGGYGTTAGSVVVGVAWTSDFVSATGTAEAKATSAPTLDALTLSSTGTVTTAGTVTGTATPTLGDLSLSASGRPSQFWTNSIGVVPQPDESLVKVDTSPGWAAGAASLATCPSGVASIEWTMPADTGGYVYCGLSHGDPDQGSASINYAFYTYGLSDGAIIGVWENGSNMAVSAGTYSAGTKLRITLSGGSVSYYKDDVWLYTSVQSPVYPLLVDVSIWSPNAVQPTIRLLSGFGGQVPWQSMALAVRGTRF